MKLFQKKESIGEPSLRLVDCEGAEKRRKNRKYIVISLLNTLWIYGLYIILMQFPDIHSYLLFAYLILLGGFSFGYVFYNRGFTRKGITVEMLPRDWSEEEKTAYIEDGERRLKNSKWCITLIIPFVFTFFMDIFYLFIYMPYLAPLFGELL